VTVARTLAIPPRAGIYRRRTTAVTLPFSLALLTIIMTTHVLKGVPTAVSGVPVATVAFSVGALFALPT